MNRFTLLFLFPYTLAQFFDQERCAIDYRSLENMWEEKLKHDITCGTHRRPPVTNGSEPLIVKLSLLIEQFTYDPELQEFSALTMTFFSWKEEKFKWDPKNYENLDTIQTATDKIWAPRIKLINDLGVDEFEWRYIYIPCEISSSGVVRCIVRIVFKVHCQPDLQNWPYDPHYCKMEFGPYFEEDIKIQLDVGTRDIEIVDDGNQWKIKDYQQFVNKTSEKQLTLKFLLERHTEGLAAIIIYPSLTLSVLTCCCLLIDGRLGRRLVVMCFSLLCHFYFIKQLTLLFPENSKDSPKLLLYYRGSLILTSILVAVSCVLNVICKRDVQCPNWITSLNDFVAKNFLRFLVWPRWECESSEKADHFIRDWTEFANIVNTISIFVTGVVYVCLHHEFMPHPRNFD